MRSSEVESTLYSYVERFRTLLAPEAWQRFAMDLPKNDLLALFFLHRQDEARMSEVADYLNAPLNTATGVVARLQRRGLVERSHDPDDKRVVVVSLTDTGREQVSGTLREGLALVERVLDGLTAEQIRLLLDIFDRVLNTVGQQAADRTQPRTTRHIVID